MLNMNMLPNHNFGVISATQVVLFRDVPERFKKGFSRNDDFKGGYGVCFGLLKKSF